MVTDINRKRKARRQYVQMSVFCSVLGLLCAFLAAGLTRCTGRGRADAQGAFDFAEVKGAGEGVYSREQ